MTFINIRMCSPDISVCGIPIMITNLKYSFIQGYNIFTVNNNDHYGNEDEVYPPEFKEESKLFLFLENEPFNEFIHLFRHLRYS